MGSHRRPTSGHMEPIRAFGSSALPGIQTQPDTSADIRNLVRIEGVRGSNPLSSTKRSSSLKERAGVKGGCGLQFCGGMAFAGHGGMALWLAFPDRCRVRASGLAGQGPGGARPRSGAAGVLDAGPRADDGWRRERPRACARAMRLWAPHRRLCGWQACWLPSSLRVCPGLAGRGAWGGFASRGGRGQSRFRSRRRSGWCRLRRGAQDLAAARPSGPAAHAAALVARRMCPSRMP